MCARFPSFQTYYQNKLRLAIIGQSLFGQEVYSSLRKQGHKVVGVFTVPDKDGKADPLGEYSPTPPVCRKEFEKWQVKYMFYQIQGSNDLDSAR